MKVVTGRRGQARARPRTLEAQHATDGVGGDVAGDLRILLQPAERVLVPVRSVWNVDAEAVPVGDELVPALRTHTEQHLELVLLALQASSADDARRFAEQVLVVGRDPDVRPLLDETLEAAHKARAHLVEPAIRDRRRLDVDALA